MFMARMYVESPKRHEVKCVCKCHDGSVYEYTLKTLIVHNKEEAEWYVAYWNTLAKDKYQYTLTGVVEDLTQDEHKRLSAYEGGTHRLYIAA